MKTTAKTILGATLILLVMALCAPAFSFGYDRSMVVHCNYLSEQAEEYEGFFISALDKNECADVYGITIDAPVL